jgi:hypothetical protein
MPLTVSTGIEPPDSKKESSIGGLFDGSSSNAVVITSRLDHSIGGVVSAAGSTPSCSTSVRPQVAQLLFVPLSAHIGAYPRVSDASESVPRFVSLHFRAMRPICQIASHARGRWFERSRAHVEANCGPFSAGQPPTPTRR